MTLRAGIDLQPGGGLGPTSEGDDSSVADGAIGSNGNCVSGSAPGCDTGAVTLLAEENVSCLAVGRIGMIPACSWL